MRAPSGVAKAGRVSAAKKSRITTGGWPAAVKTKSGPTRPNAASASGNPAGNATGAPAPAFNNTDSDPPPLCSSALAAIAFSSSVQRPSRERRP
ncbi:MAG: hypothetical protein A3B62_00685 [Rhodospirillales bacterium RIFCSPLOWO2_01_FULL_65_14]|nr:MAG: hypothetical protein A3B62_00685 [Rhodospirillales bacterium RIFCSPLOWO2_01_FULL_65_14]